MHKKLPLIHFVSFVVAITLVAIFLFSLYITSAKKQYHSIFITGEQKVQRGVYDNLSISEDAELEFISSIKNPNQLTIFGSSEFSSSPYCPYYFLPDTLGLQTLGIGHAHHQSFSILCELLAAQEYLENSKICIVISPSWFHTDGTNSEAFTEFVRPNFLKKIATDEYIDLKYKIAVGHFIYKHSEEFTSISNTMEYFIDEYLIFHSRNLNFFKAKLRRFMKNLHSNSLQIESVHYDPEVFPKSESKKFLSDQQVYLKNLQQDFLAKITTNDIYVNDDYFTTYLLDDSGSIQKDSVHEINLEKNQELEDFKLLIDLLASKNADCSFIIQPLNPYYYQYPERNKPLIDTLTGLLDLHNFPYLNMYVYNKETYEPGILKDVMHLSDFGWMKINFFLDSLYYER